MAAEESEAERDSVLALARAAADADAVAIDTAFRTIDEEADHGASDAERRAARRRAAKGVHALHAVLRRAGEARGGTAWATALATLLRAGCGSDPVQDESQTTAEPSWVNDTVDGVGTPLLALAAADGDEAALRPRFAAAVALLSAGADASIAVRMGERLYTPFDMLAFSGVRDVRLRDLLRAARDFRGSGREYIKQSLSTFIAGVVACDGWTVFADLPHIVSLVPVQGSVVQRLRARADELETAVDAVRTVVDGGGDALEALTRATEQVEAAVAEARSVDDMRARLVETEASVEALTEEVASLREIADLRAEEIGALRSSIGAGRATVSEAARRRAAASALAAELQRTLAMPDDVTDAAASAPELEDTAVNEGAQVTARLHDEAAGLRYSVKGLQEECDAIAADNKLVQLQNSVISALVSVAAATVVATWCTSS